MKTQTSDNAIKMLPPGEYKIILKDRSPSVQYHEEYDAFAAQWYRVSQWEEYDEHSYYLNVEKMVSERWLQCIAFFQLVNEFVQNNKQSKSLPKFNQFEFVIKEVQPLQEF